MPKGKSKSPKRPKCVQSEEKPLLKEETGSKKMKTNQNIEETKIINTETKQFIEQQCFICATPYNLNRKLPVIACQNKHTFCLNCITLSLHASKSKCPTCRATMQPSELNSKIYHEVLEVYKQKNKHLDQSTVRKYLIKLSIKKFGKKYSNFDDYQTVSKTNKFTKIKRNNEPSLLIMEPQMKDKSLYTFSFTYHPLRKIQISFGVGVYDKFLLKMVENCGFDTKIIDFFMRKENVVSLPNTKNNDDGGMRIILHVNLQKYEIHWFEERQQQKSKRQRRQEQKGGKVLHLISSELIFINHKVGDLAYYPYCVLYAVGDSVELN